jgi:thiol-disulfide isomerase/thioredoxin
VVQVSKTQSFLVNGQKRLLPLEYVVRIYQHNLLDGQRKVSVYSVQALAPIKINTSINPQQWQMTVPAKTLVSYVPNADTQMLDERPFLYDAGGGSLWQQDKTAREVRAAKMRVMRARALYDEKADGEAQIAAALKLAAAQNKGVLLQFGAYWCSPCHVLHGLLEKNAILAPLVKANYITVPIDLNGWHNATVANRLKGIGQGGLPFVVILDATGKRLAAPPSEYFAPKVGKEAFDVEKIADFLNRWKPQ